MCIYYTADISGCVCPGDILTYECTVMGGTATVWTGIAFNCSRFSSTEIVLLHSRFISANGTSFICNNGAIVVGGLSVDGNNYTSQLNVTVTPETIGKTIECHYDDGRFAYTRFSSTISITGLSPSA